MLIKATRLRPGVPLQLCVPVIVDMVVAEVVVDGMVVLEAGKVMGNVVAIKKLVYPVQIEIKITLWCV